jgi:hypothetical protein
MAVGRQRTMGVFFLIVAGAIAALFGIGQPGGEQAHFVLNLQSSTAISVPDLVVPVGPTAFVVATICAFLGAFQVSRGFGTWT